MMLYIYILCQILLFVCSFYIIRKYSSWIEIYILISMYTFNSIGVVYYLNGGDAYYIPKITTYIYIFLLFFAFILPLIFTSKFNVNESKVCFNENRKRIIMIFLISLVPYLYIFIFREGFIFYKALTGVSFSEKDRPDVVGNIPMYYTFTVWVSSLSLPVLVALIKYSDRVTSKMVLIVLLIMLCLSIGSKSALMMIAVYFYLTWDTNFTKKIIFGFFVVTFLFLFYFLMKVIYVPHVLENENIIYTMIGSLFRRVSVINYSISSFVYEYFVEALSYIPDGFSHLKQFVFYSLYGYLPGGAPVPLYMQGSYIYQTLFLALIYNFLICFFLVLFFKLALNYSSGIYFEVIRFLIFYGIVLMSMGFIEDILIRSVFPIIFFCIICNFPIIKLGKRFRL